MKRGFTLIELLAVIVILAIVALIATPIILGIINDAKIRSAEQSVNGIIDSLKQKYASLQLKNNVPLPVYVSFGDISLQYETEIENLTDISNEIEVDGNLPTNGMIILKKDGKVEFGYSDITMNGYVCTIDNDKVNCGIQSNSKYTKESCFEFVVKGDHTQSYLSNIITNYKDYCPKDVVIPPTITLEGKTYVVKNIGPSAFEKKELLSVDLSNVTNLNNIGYGAFRYNKLKEVDLSKNEQVKIKSFAFSNNEIENYKLYNKKQVLDENSYGVFNNNKLPDKNAYIYLRNSDGTIDNTTIISYGSANKNIVIPSTIERIYDYAFYHINIETIDFSRIKNLKSIGSNAFAYTKIDSGQLDLSNFNNLEEIKSGAFRGALLTSVDLSGCTSLKTIGSSAFSAFDNANEIKTVDLSGCTSLESIESAAFWMNRISQINLSGCTNLKTIGSRAFEENSLRNFDFSELISLTEIGAHAFYRNGLSDIDLSNCSNLTTIGTNAFYKYKSSIYVNSNSNLTQIKTNGKEFDWNAIINGSRGTSFITGVVENSGGNVTIE